MPSRPCAIQSFLIASMISDLTGSGSRTRSQLQRRRLIFVHRPGFRSIIPPFCLFTSCDLCYKFSLLIFDVQQTRPVAYLGFQKGGQSLPSPAVTFLSIFFRISVLGCYVQVGGTRFQVGMTRADQHRYLRHDE